MVIKKTSIIIFSLLLLFTACKKPEDLVTNPLLEQYFAANVLNRNFTVSLAMNDNTDLTPDYKNYVFVLLKSDFYNGPLTATTGSTVYTGTWSSNDDYSKLVINLPVPPSEFTFLNRAWRFTSKSFPTLKLSPWGSTAPLVLHMYRQ